MSNVIMVGVNAFVAGFCMSGVISAEDTVPTLLLGVLTILNLLCVLWHFRKIFPLDR